MKRLLFVLALAANFGIISAGTGAYVGPHFNYTRLKFDTPSELEGYMGGLAAGLEYNCRCLYTSVDFEGYWNAGPITGTPCERSSLTEYIAEWKLGYSCSNIIVYTGFGYNRFENEQNPQGDGLCYEYDKLFIPVGIYAFCCLTNCIRGGIQFEWRPDVYSCVDVASLSFNNELENAYRVQLPISASYYWGCCHFNLAVIPFFDWNEFGKVCDTSPNEVNVDIPQLRRWNAGLRVLLGYHF